jgi:ATP-dependent helicase STH1/SNF2
MAFRTLSANKPLPEYLKTALFGDDSGVSPGAQPTPNDALPQKIVDVTVVHDKAHPAEKKAGIVHQGLSFSSASDPYSFLAKVRPGSQDLKARLVIPSILPVAPDPETLKKERERFLAARVQYRIKELESLPATLTNENGLKLKALIELKSLRLLEKQRKLRHDILTSVSSATTLATAIDRNAYKRMKRQSLREARQTEKQERSNRAERDMKERQKHLDFLSHILNHGKEFTACHRNQAGKAARLGASVARFHVNAAKEEEKRMQRISEERLKALKENDEEAYLKLIDKTKDTRITHLLAQTNEFLTTLTNAVNMQKRSVGDEIVPEQAVAPAAAAVTAAAPGEVVAPKDQEEAENLDYYNTAHKVHEIVTEQPSILIGGKLKEYQIKGLQWMVSLYNNRLNGILADEMVCFALTIM